MKKSVFLILAVAFASSVQAVRFERVLVRHITYIINGKAPRCYLSTIVDACTKELLAWQLSASLEIDFVLKIQGSTYIADRTAGSHRTEGDDLRHMIRAVLARHVVDHLLPALIAEVDIQIGHGHALGV